MHIKIYSYKHPYTLNIYSYPGLVALAEAVKREKAALEKDSAKSVNVHLTLAGTNKTIKFRANVRDNDMI